MVKTKPKIKPTPAKTVGFKASSKIEIMNEFGGMDEKGKKKTLNSVVLDTMNNVLKKQELIKKICPHLEFRTVTSTEMTIKDTHTGNVVEVALRDNRLWCSECKPKFCMHNMFTLLHLKTGSLIDQDGK